MKTVHSHAAAVRAAVFVLSVPGTAASSLVGGCAPRQIESRPHPQVEPLREASGVARDGNRLLFAGDGTPDTYFAYELQVADFPKPPGPVLGQFTIDTAHVTTHALGLPLAIDLEGIALVGPGRPLLISERTRSLVSPGKILAEYPDAFGELGNRGIEGLAVRSEGDSIAVVATMWEGGFLERARLPAPLRSQPVLVDRALNPVLCVHRIALDTLRWDRPARACDPRDTTRLDLSIELNTPIPPDTTQRFRAPDLVWLPDGSGFLVLLSSQNSTASIKIEYKYKWLQRFDLKGNRVGEPLNLCSVLPDAVRGGRGGNVEGMGWFQEGKSVALVNDYDKPATVVILDVSDPWPTTSRDVECK